MKILISLFLLIPAICLGNTNKQIYAWASPSSLWGQGHIGTTLSDKEGPNQTLIYNYVFDWGDEEFSFHEASYYIKENGFSLGSRYRWQDNHEFAPFIGWVFDWNFLGVYNEAEYRFDPTIYPDNYLRTRTKIDVTFMKGKELSPYIAADLFVNWDSVEIEKTRLYVGYTLTVGDRSGTLFVIPWIDGELEGGWLDQRRFGVGSIINF